MNIQRALKAKAIFASFYQVKMSPKLSYKILKLCKPIEEEENFYEGERNKIIAEYALKDADGKPQVDEQGFIKFDEVHRQEIVDALQQLNSIEIEVPNIKFTLDELDILKLSVEDLAALEDFLDEV